MSLISGLNELNMHSDLYGMTQSPPRYVKNALDPLMYSEDSTTVEDVEELSVEDIANIEYYCLIWPTMSMLEYVMHVSIALHLMVQDLIYLTLL